MITKLACYYYYKFKRSSFLDFVDQGLGIEARFARNKRYWKPHLTACKNFIIDSISRNSKQSEIRSVCILGAGRLFDVPLNEFPHSLKKIILVDADPGCIQYWKKFKKFSEAEIQYDFTDISSRLEDWTNKLLSYFQNKQNQDQREFENELAIYLQKLTDLPISNKWHCPDCDLIISLNLLSQIGIYWRDRVFNIIKKYHPSLKFQNDPELPGIDRALDKMSALLEQEHLNLLAGSGVKNIIMIHDDEFYYYSKDKSPWQTEQALSLKKETGINAYQLQHQKCWLWHIVPQGSEHKDYGEIHRVQARYLRKI